MKVGLIFECGPQGADKAVCEHLARMLEPDIEISSVTLDSKPDLVRDCGEAAAALLDEGCERVVIIWDLYPPWGGKKQKPCRRKDRENILQSLAQAGVNSPHVYLVCIEKELEAWLLADERAIRAVLSRDTFEAKVPRTKNPEQTTNPKKRLIKIFKENGRNSGYTDLTDAIRIVRELTDLKKLKKCATFVRFAVKVTGKENIF